MNVDPKAPDMQIHNCITDNVWTCKILQGSHYRKSHHSMKVWWISSKILPYDNHSRIKPNVYLFVYLFIFFFAMIQAILWFLGTILVYLFIIVSPCNIFCLVQFISMHTIDLKWLCFVNHVQSITWNVCFSLPSIFDVEYRIKWNKIETYCQ